MKTMEQHIPPRKAVIGVGVGLLLMSFFTLLWLTIALGESHGKELAAVGFIFVSFSVLFVVNGIQLLLIAKQFPPLSKSNKSNHTGMDTWFGIIFGIEGASIFILAWILNLTNHRTFLIPGIALIVGFHFYPMAKLFKRKIDYYIATYSCIFALTGMYIVLHNATETIISVFIGIGMAVATSWYGFYMLSVKYKLLKHRPLIK